MKTLALFVAFIFSVECCIAQDSSARAQGRSSESKWTTGPTLYFASTTLIHNQIPSYVPSIRGQTFARPDQYTNNISLGWSLEYHIGENSANSRASILGTLNYTKVQGSSRAMNTVQVWSYYFADTVYETADFGFSTYWQSVHLDLLYKFYVGATDLGILMGPYTGYVFNHQAHDSASLGGKAEWFRKDEDPQLPTSMFGSNVSLFNGKIPNSRVIDVGLVGGVDYRIRLQRIDVYPGVFYRVNVNRLDETSRYFAWQFCLRASW